MRELKVIKNYQQMVKSSLPVSYDDDLGVTEFRAFELKAELHATRVQNPFALKTMQEILDGLQNSLKNRQKVLNLT